MICIKQFNGIALVAGILFFLCSMYFEKGVLFFQVAGIVLLMIAAYLYSRNREDDNFEEDE
ncbi:hypothetical protein [Nonlabens ulvanivorans]|uniref:hypothetical protein n=1 Tax=Nonlabens ulvanivorans TaxID=906888 RepID=UPI002943A241|nr:hypothetical protein [Nonlabens ulvanivorans]WOI22983.1 hypothetical protein R1T42_00765 [Nonlabens ulvanivorans]